MSESGGPPLVLVRGNASAEEIAALVAVLAARRAAAAEPPAGPASISRWGSPAAKLRGPLSHGPGAWRASARPG